jgi:hypothetical protein
MAMVTKNCMINYIMTVNEMDRMKKQALWSILACISTNQSVKLQKMRILYLPFSGFLDMVD